MTTGRPGDGADRGPVAPALAVVFATVGYLALVIFGLGMLSLALDESVIEEPGLGPLPGVAATTLSIVAFGATLWSPVRRTQPSFWNSAWVMVASFLAYLAGLWIMAVATGTAVGIATAVAGRIATSGFGLVIAAAALVAAWSGIALVRTRARRPRWPWESDDEETL